MNYKALQKQKHIEIRDLIFNDPGFGYFKGHHYPFILSNPELNLWAGIREDAMRYFKKNKIEWWGGDCKPTGHLLSSQIACVNHLFAIRKREDLATAILKGIDPEIEKALVLKSGFVEFEMLGSRKLGKERNHQRGANCTSVDAMMLGQRNDGSLVIVLIEWKYTESYSGTSDKSKGDSGKTRVDAYKDLFTQKNCPIKEEFYKDLFYEPFYQLMRQTLLANQMANDNDFGAEDYLHIDVIPKGNKDLRNKITSPNLKGKDMHEAWTNCLNLRGKDRYKMVSNEDFLKPIFTSKTKEDFETESLYKYLNIRYY